LAEGRIVMTRPKLTELDAVEGMAEVGENLPNSYYSLYVKIVKPQN